jgi:hypothetical protein
MFTADSSAPTARAATTDNVGSTHSDARTYSDSASRRIMPASLTGQCSQPADTHITIQLKLWRRD